jgi:hypothetical protein
MPLPRVPLGVPFKVNDLGNAEIGARLQASHEGGRRGSESCHLIGASLHATNGEERLKRLETTTHFVSDQVI